MEYFLPTWTKRIPLVLDVLLVGFFCFVADHIQDTQLQGMQINSPSPRNHMDTCPLMQIFDLFTR